MKTDLLQKIENLFFENAFAELSMDDIAKHLGIKKASLYYHFSSKEAMFVEILEFSYEKYRKFLEKTFEEKDVSKMIKSLVAYPLEQKNLYSIILQRGYCKIESIRTFISEKGLLTQKLFIEEIGKKYHLNNEKIIIFRSVIEDLSKKYCILGCPNEIDFGKTVKEIVVLFFK